ncbi:MAG: class II aldolase/adducin family protein [Hydrogenophaga sp.]|jgi:ribulose-5-phosphate 4-epimerase/fuculose-1-phosphate aldolase|uniref:class II aldolase/adducin family protein n=1 Tax=Hydrogenophaga sp. TaxID=1904254 RepID=UPI002609179C|nr:class II aldolase/adducin family protein [Hydrogenophaga sp.]MCW5668762.1 class II aldolase/adducin family protein [Hydrogenophaga sp.]
MKARAQAEVAQANRILAHLGILDAYGHVSARLPGRADRFLISRSLAPALVTVEDLMELDLDGEPAAGDERKPYLERFIHGAIYRARPDVQAIVHSHAPSVIPFSVSSARLRPVCHMSGFLGGGAPVFDIRRHFGCTDMLVRNAGQGAELARSLGSHAAALMRGHGFVVVGGSVQSAVYRAVYTEWNARLQREAISLGGHVTYLSEEEAALAEAANAGTVERPWQLWLRECGLNEQA